MSSSFTKRPPCRPTMAPRHNSSPDITAPVSPRRRSLLGPQRPLLKWHSSKKMVLDKLQRATQAAATSATSAATAVVSEARRLEMHLNQLRKRSHLHRLKVSVSLVAVALLTLVAAQAAPSHPASQPDPTPLACPYPTSSTRRPCFSSFLSSSRGGEHPRGCSLSHCPSRSSSGCLYSSRFGRATDGPRLRRRSGSRSSACT